MKKNSDKEICRENEIIKFYSLYFNIFNTNMKILFISVFGNPNLHVIFLFKVTNIYFTNMVNIHFVN